VVDLVHQLGQEKLVGRGKRLATTLTLWDFVVLDEPGYLPFSKNGGQLLFQLISKLYERISLPITTNMTFAEWHQAFADSKMTSDLLETGTHY
jgi:DNA replication protein DnaC